MAAIYLDSNSTTSIDSRVVDVMREVWDVGALNPLSAHADGRRALSILEDSRRIIADTLACSRSEVVFTSGGTESNNLAVLGTASSASAGRRHAVVSGIEHPSVLEPFRSLVSQGWSVTEVAPDTSGVVDPGSILEALRPDTAVVSLMLVNNEIGTVQPVAETAGLLRSRGIVFHCDAVQAFGKISFDTASLNVDLLSISGHKVHGPHGAGALFVRRGTRIGACTFGGHQERGLRAGTQDVAGARGFAEAARLAVSRIEQEEIRIGKLRDEFESLVLKALPDAWVNGRASVRVSGTSSITIPGVDSGALVAALDIEGIRVSSGAACQSLSGEPSHVLKAIGLDSRDAGSTIRVSFSRLNGDQDAGLAAEIVVRCALLLRSETPGAGRW